MVEQLEVFLVKKQATFGTAEASLTGADNYFPALKGLSKLEPVPQYSPVEECSAGYDQDLGVVGFVNSNVELSCYMRSLGTSTAPDFGLLAQAAGFSETVTAVGGNGNKYIYQPSSTLVSKDLTVWHYAGGYGSNASILTKAANVVGNAKVTIEAGKPSIFALTGGKGQYVSEAAATLPTPTKTRTLYPAALGWTVSIHGVAYKLIKADFDMVVALDQYIDGTQAYGFGNSEIGQKKGKFTLQFYADASLALPSVAGLAGAVESAITIVYGVATNKLHFSIGYPQIQDWKKSAVGNLTVFDVSGIMSRNDFVITTNNDLV